MKISKQKGLPLLLVKRVKYAFFIAIGAFIVAPVNPAFALNDESYTKTVLASDTTGLAKHIDSNLVNPWGLSHSQTGSWSLSDNNSGHASFYNSDGVSVAPAIMVPGPNNTGSGAPTGNVFNGVATDMPQAFVISKGKVSGPSAFIYATEDGTIAGWNKSVDSSNARIAVDRSTATDAQGDSGAVYKGLATGFHHGQPFIYATNFRFGTVEMFDQHFNLVKSFTDPQLTTNCPSKGQCYAPFGIQNIHGDLYITFALQQPSKHDDQAGAGNGFVDVFDTNGALEKRLISGGHLNSPWGVALAPENFGRFSHHLLVGNFGDGVINAYDLNPGSFDDSLKNKNGNAIQTDGLWGIAFGNDGQAGKSNELFFTAGIGGENHGVFGKIQDNDNK